MVPEFPAPIGGATRGDAPATSARALGDAEHGLRAGDSQLAWRLIAPALPPGNLPRRRIELPPV